MRLLQTLDVGSIIARCPSILIFQKISGAIPDCMWMDSIAGSRDRWAIARDRPCGPSAFARL